MTVLNIEEHGDEIISNKVLLFRITSSILLILTGFLMLYNLQSIGENPNNINFQSSIIPIILTIIITIMYYYQHKWSEKDNKVKT